MKVEGLNKENFFTQEWKDKYPKASDLFCKWIDRYKEKVFWVFLFSGEEIKFHHLPLDMQLGIINRWTVECDQVATYFNVIGSNTIEDHMRGIERIFELTEQELNREK